MLIWLEEHAAVSACQGVWWYREGGILTCPLDAVISQLQPPDVMLPISEVQLTPWLQLVSTGTVSPGPFQGLMVILEKGGPCSLFRELGPNLREVAASRPTFFAAHSNCKEKLNGVLRPDSTRYMILAVVAHFTAIIAPNLIWLIKNWLHAGQPRAKE